jgi:hypothetical protein
MLMLNGDPDDPGDPDDEVEDLLIHERPDPRKETQTQ